MPTASTSSFDRLAAVWRTVFDAEATAPDSDFFLLGGDSLTAMDLASGAAVAFPEIPDVDMKLLEAIFEHPRLGELARHVEALGNEPAV